MDDGNLHIYPGQYQHNARDNSLWAVYFHSICWCLFLNKTQNYIWHSEYYYYYSYFVVCYFIINSGLNNLFLTILLDSLSKQNKNLKFSTFSKLKSNNNGTVVIYCRTFLFSSSTKRRNFFQFQKKIDKNKFRLLGIEILKKWNWLFFCISQFLLVEYCIGLKKINLVPFYNRLINL